MACYLQLQHGGDNIPDNSVMDTCMIIPMMRRLALAFFFFFFDYARSITSVWTVRMKGWVIALMWGSP